MWSVLIAVFGITFIMFISVLIDRRDRRIQKNSPYEIIAEGVYDSVNYVFHEKIIKTIIYFRERRNYSLNCTCYTFLTLPKGTRIKILKNLTYYKIEKVD